MRRSAQLLQSTCKAMFHHRPMSTATLGEQQLHIYRYGRCRGGLFLATTTIVGSNYYFIKNQTEELKQSVNNKE